MFMQTFSLLKTCLQQEVLDTARINMHSSLWIHNSSRVKDTFVHPSYPSAPYPQECLLECNPHTRALRFTLNASYIWTRTHSYAHRVRTRCIPLLSPVREPHCSHCNARTLTELYSDGGRRRQSRGRYALVRGDIPHGKNVLGWTCCKCVCQHYRPHSVC